MRNSTMGCHQAAAGMAQMREFYSSFTSMTGAPSSGSATRQHDPHIGTTFAGAGITAG